jgi:hypothetical protein
MRKRETETERRFRVYKEAPPGRRTTMSVKPLYVRERTRANGYCDSGMHHALWRSEDLRNRAYGYLRLAL